MKKEILKGKRVLLRSPKLSDANLFFKWLNDKEIIKFLDPKLIKNVEEEKKFLSKIRKSKDEIFFSAEDENKNLIGNSVLRLNKKNNSASLGIVIGDKKKWGKGYGTEIIKILIDFVFKKLKYNRFELYVSVENKRAVNLYKKIGFKIDGILRENKWNKKTRRFEDQMLMSILKKEYRK